MGAKLIYWEVEQKLKGIYLLHCNLGVVELIQRGLGKHWVQFSLESDLLIESQLDQRKVVPEEIDSNRTVARELGILNIMNRRGIHLALRR